MPGLFFWGAPTFPGDRFIPRWQGISINGLLLRPSVVFLLCSLCLGVCVCVWKRFKKTGNERRAKRACRLRGRISSERKHDQVSSTISTDETNRSSPDSIRYEWVDEEREREGEEAAAQCTRARAFRVSASVMGQVGRVKAEQLGLYEVFCCTFLGNTVLAHKKKRKLPKGRLEASFTLTIHRNRR